MEDQKQPCPENNLIWAILCTVMCCVPLGIVAVVKATSVEKLWYQGQHAEAEKAAAEAKKWAMWGAGAALVFCLLYIVLYLGIFGIALLSEM